MLCIAAYYVLTSPGATAFSGWEAKFRARRFLPRRKRAAFDALHEVVARLAAVQEWASLPEGPWGACAAFCFWDSCPFAERL